MNNVKIDKKLLSEIDSFVKLNNLGETNTYISDLLKIAFTKEKFGDSPFNNTVSVHAKTIEKWDNLGFLDKTEVNKEIIKEDKTEVNKEIIEEDDLYNE